MELESSLRADVPLKLGYLAALAGLFFLWWILLSISLWVVFWLALPRFAALAEYLSPGSLETPLSAAGPMLYAAFTAVVVNVAILAYLTYRRVVLAKFFLVLLVVGSASLVATFYLDVALVQHFNGWYPAAWSPRPEYPVLVVTPGEDPGSLQAQVVQWSDLPNFRRQNPASSFVVPDGQEAALQSQLPRHDLLWAIQTRQQSANSPLLSARFEVASLPNGRQKIIVTGYWFRNSNATVRSWYEADARGVYPRYINEGDTYGLYMLDTLLFIVLIDVAAVAFYLRRRWKKGWRGLPNYASLDDAV
jgi:hypothetical protein